VKNKKMVKEKTETETGEISKGENKLRIISLFTPQNASRTVNV
jgi:hypothetical protein